MLPGVGDLVAAAAVNAPVRAKTPQVVGHFLAVMSLGVVPRRGAMRVRKSRLVNPWGSSR